MKRSNELRRLRKEHGLSLQALAVEAEAGISTLVAVEKYSYYPARPDTRRRIAEALGVGEGEIWSGEAELDRVPD